MALFRVALANVAYPETPEASISSTVDSVRLASREGASLVCFRSVLRLDIDGRETLCRLPTPLSWSGLGPLSNWRPPRQTLR